MKPQNIDLDLLRTFIAIVDNGSISRALGQIHKTQSTVSLQLKRLESQLDTTLFNRQARTLELTADGKKLVSYARRMLVLHDKTVSEFLKNQNDLQITIGCPDDYTQIVMPHLIDLLQKQNDEITVTLISKNSGELRALLDDGQLDLAILTRPPQSEEGHLIYQDHGVWVYADEKQLTQRPIKLALFESTCKFNSTIVDGFEKKQIPYHLVCQASNSQFLLNLACDKKAVTVVSKKAFLQMKDSQLLSASSIDEFGTFPLPVVEVTLVSKAGNQQIAGLSLEQLTKLLAKQIK